VQYLALRTLCPKGFLLTQQGDGWDLSEASFDLVGFGRKATSKSKIAGLDVEAGSETSFAMGNLTIEGRFSESSPSDIKAVLTNFPFEGVDSILAQSMMLSGKVDSLTFQYLGTLPQPSFKLDALVSNGPIAELSGSGHIALTYIGGVLNVADLDYLAGGGRLTAKGSIMLDSTQVMPFESEPFSVNMEGIDLRILQGLTDVVLLQEGQITGAVTIQGDLMHPALLGKIHLENARFLLGELYNYISDFSGDIYFEKDRILFGCSNEHAADAQCISPMIGLMDGKPMNLNGEIQMANLVPTNYDMHLYAGGMNFRSLPGSQFKLAVDVGLKGAVEQLKLSGKIKIISGLMNMPFGSSDIEQEPELSTGIELPFDMDLALGAERGIWLRNNDADLELAANIRVEYSRGLLSLSGNLDTVRGVYHFIGRDFTIEQGQLTFLGTPTFDPTLNIEGVTTVIDESTTNGRMSIYIKVTGTLTHPEITLSSPDHPNLVQNDLVQILAFNMSYQNYLDMQGSNGQQNINPFEQQREQYLTGYLSGRISGAIRPFVSLDTLSFEWNSLSQTPDQVTVGKYLTPNLYLSYVQPLYYNPSTVHKIDLEYFLGGGFSILGTANERARERAAGLSLRYLYRY
jgi:autotransporter translocation and assembly factor TamB